MESRNPKAECPGYSITKLLALPPELLLEILEKLVDEDLYNLALSCHTLNQLSLSTFLARHNIPDPGSDSCIRAQVNDHPLKLTMLNIALWIQRLRSIDICMSEGCLRVVKDVRTLKRVVGRVDGLETMVLNFQSLDSWVWRTKDKQMDKDQWVRELTSLLDLAIDRGCCELDIQGGGVVNKLYAESEPSRIPLDCDCFKPNEDGNTGVDTNFATASTPAIIGQRNLKLQKLTLESTMLFQDSFYAWTIGMLCRVASSLTTLALHCATLTCIQWSQLLASLQLPLLSSFELQTVPNKTPRMRYPRFVDLLNFFEQQPSLQYLNLQAVERPEPIPVLEKPILPNLKSLMANSAWVHCLLRFRKDDTNTLLTSIGFTTEYFAFEKPDDYTHTYNLIDKALKELVRYTRDITLELCLRSAKGMEGWLEKHISLGNHSIFATLYRVTTLRISTSNCIEMDARKRKLLPQWVALFPPSLRDLEFEEGWVGQRVMEDVGLLENLARQYPFTMLDNVRNVNGKEVNMTHLVRKLGYILVD